ncbi:hypothetical protein GGS26DRAFT_112668 [Hypomontagnella submonticulosa]|nr:hypothetical protein GGS26DRAFT_112668 [Hypomontagnella submonticulosa]
MAVTELAWLTIVGPSITAEAKKATDHGFGVQDEWCIRNAPALPRGREGRGAAFFEQVEDPSVTLLTAHWESVEQHMAWIESPENKVVFPGLADHFQLDKLVLSHIDGVEIFKKSKATGVKSPLESPIISVSRLAVPAEKRQAFDQAWNEVKGSLEEFAGAELVKYGWRIEKEDPTKEEFVLVCGWPSVEEHGEFTKVDGFQKLDSTVRSLAEIREVKHYQRILL